MPLSPVNEALGMSIAKRSVFEVQDTYCWCCNHMQLLRRLVSKSISKLAIYVKCNVKIIIKDILIKYFGDGKMKLTFIGYL